jgi:hypothetical protein
MHKYASRVCQCQQSPKCSGQISVAISHKGPWRLARTLATQTGMIPPGAGLKDQESSLKLRPLREGFFLSKSCGFTLLNRVPFGKFNRVNTCPPSAETPRRVARQRSTPNLSGSSNPQFWPIDLFPFFSIVGHIAEEFQNAGLNRLFPESIIKCIHINTDSF